MVKASWHYDRKQRCLMKFINSLTADEQKKIFQEVKNQLFDNWWEEGMQDGEEYLEEYIMNLISNGEIIKRYQESQRETND